MRDGIVGYADAVIEDAVEAGDVDALAGELAAVGDLLDGSQELRFALSDPQVPAPSRRGVLNDLLRGRVGDPTLRTLAHAVEVDRATEFPDDVAWLSARAAAARDHLVSIDDGPLGRTTAEHRLAGYAAALLEQVDRHQLDEVEDELFRFMQVVDSSEELRAVLTDRDVEADARRSLVVDLLSDKATPQTLRLAGYAVRIGRPRDFVALLADALRRVAEEADRRIAEVRAAVELDDDERRRLSDALGRMTGRQVELRVQVDSSILGGFVATVGDTVVDGSTRRRLEQLQERLVLPEATVNQPPTITEPRENR